MLFAKNQTKYKYKKLYLKLYNILSTLFDFDFMILYYQYALQVHEHSLLQYTIV